MGCVCELAHQRQERKRSTLSPHPSRWCLKRVTNRITNRMKVKPSGMRAQASMKAIQIERASIQISPPVHKPPVSVSSMGAIQRACAAMQPKQTRAVSVASMGAIHGLCACIQGAPPKHKHAVSVSSMGAMGRASIQAAPSVQTRGVSVGSTGAEARVGDSGHRTRGHYQHNFSLVLGHVVSMSRSK